MRHTSIWASAILALLAAALLGGCPRPAERQADGQVSGPEPVAEEQGAAAEQSEPHYPILLIDRPYKDIHDSAKQAWFLVETAYYVVKQKYVDASILLKSQDPAERKRGSDLRTEVAAEIDSAIFSVNETVESLFLEAIDQEPDNPLNYATYAYYLKPRRRMTGESSFRDAEPEALEMMDKAIELWPDEASFYLLKAHILTAAHRCHDWFRSQMAQDLVIADRLSLVGDLIAEAKQYYPDNFQINYYYAILLARYTDPAEFDTVHDRIISELREGNHKRHGFSFYPPPLPPFPSQIQNVDLVGTETEAKYVDQWRYFGHYDVVGISRLVESTVARLSWPEDKDQVADLMYFLYQIGRTRPFDRTSFSLQLKVLNPLQEALPEGDPERLKLAEATRYLNEQYRAVALTLYSKGLIKDETRIDVRGINDLETGAGGITQLREYVQGPQANFLHEASKILGLDFPLPEDPTLW